MTSFTIDSLQINGINAALVGTGFTAKRGKLNTNEIIVGVAADVAGAVTIKLAEDASKRPTWFVGMFSVTPKEVSEDYEIGLPVSLVTAHYWADMLKHVKTAIAAL